MVNGLFINGLFVNGSFVNGSFVHPWMGNVKAQKNHGCRRMWAATSIQASTATEKASWPLSVRV